MSLIPRSAHAAGLTLVGLLAAGLAHADGYTISFIDNGSAPTPPAVSIIGSSSAAAITYSNCGTEGCTVIESATLTGVTASLPPNYYVADPGPNPAVSDWISYSSVVINGVTNVTIGFSNVPPISGNCGSVGCQATEGSAGLFQTLNAGNISWSDPAIDTIQIEPAPMPVPVPATFWLLLSGVGLFALASRRRVLQPTV
jgi:hypothetical protein